MQSVIKTWPGIKGPDDFSLRKNKGLVLMVKMITKKLACLMMVLMCALKKVESSADVMKGLSENFGKALGDCKKEVSTYNYTSSSIKNSRKETSLPASLTARRCAGVPNIHTKTSPTQ